MQLSVIEQMKQETINKELFLRKEAEMQNMVKYGVKLFMNKSQLKASKRIALMDKPKPQDVSYRRRLEIVSKALKDPSFNIPKTEQYMFEETPDPRRSKSILYTNTHSRREEILSSLHDKQSLLVNGGELSPPFRTT